MMRRIRANHSSWRCWVLLAALPLSLSASDPGITVKGVGRVETFPDTVELRGTVSGQAELAVDAAVKFRDGKRRVEEALKNLKLDHLSVEWSGIKVGTGLPDSNAAQQAALRGQPVVGDRDQVSVSDLATITLKGLKDFELAELLDTLVRVIDVSKDAGLSLPPLGERELANFKLVDDAGSEQEAYSAAMRNARESAERLAQLAGAKLGAVRSVEVIASQLSDAARNLPAPYSYLLAARGLAAARGKLSSAKLAAISVEATLRVQFDFEGR